MKDLQLIQQIEKTFGYELKKVEQSKIAEKSFYTVDPFGYSLTYLLSPSFPFKGARHYCTDEDDNVTGLALDFAPNFLLPKDFFPQFKKLNFLSLRSSGLIDFSFLKELKGLFSLDLSRNSLSDVSVLKELKGLTTLYLSSNSLSDVSFLKEFKGLTSLYLRNNKISDVSFLKELKGLTSLDLSDNYESRLLTGWDQEGPTSLYLSGYSFSDVSFFLKEHKGLTSLYLSSNSLSDVSFLKELKGLTSLDLRNNSLSDVSFLKELKGLTSLDLSSNSLSDVSFLKELKSIKSISLGWNRNIKNYSFLKELKGLTSLDLSSNSLSDVSFLKELKGLTSLYLRNNSLSDVSFLKELKGLTSLDLSYNSLSDVSFLKELKGLTSLYLSYNSLSDVSFLKELKGLTSLDLSYNSLSDVSFLKELKGLTSLDLSSNSLSDVSLLKELKGLTSLDLRDNYLSDVSFLKELKGLTSLDLRNNSLSDVSFIKELKGLKDISLANNKIKEFPVWLAEKGLKIKIDSEYESICINLYGNPLTKPPIQVVNQGNEAILKYFKDMEYEGQDHIYEAKLLILGEPGAGKTSFARKIQNVTADLPEEEETTRGIDVHKWEFQQKFNNGEEKQITANIWDFGGQAIYKATHRFFLTHRSLYTIVADARKDDTDFYYWMHIVELFGENSPCLIVINEKENRKRDLPYSTLRGRFSILKGNKNEVNFKKPDKRLDSLIDELKSQISHLQHIGDPVPANWKKVREKLAELEKTNNIIPLHIYRELCAEHKLEIKKDQDYLSGFFHDLGVFLHFQGDDILGKSIFLNKEWILEGAYRILDNSDLAKKQGKFTRHDVENIFKKEYSDYIPEIIAIMKRFFLLYEKQGFLIAPQMLAHDPPKYDWDGTENVQFQFEYDLFMPQGILWQFIVEMKDDIKDELVWRYGVVLNFKGTEAEVIEISERNLIKIRVKGKYKEDIRAAIISKIEEINRQFKKLKPKKLVPCVCAQCKNNSQPYMFEYKTIIDAKNKQKPVQCHESFEPVQISQLLSGIEFLEQQEVPEKKVEKPVVPEKIPFYKRQWFIVIVAIIFAIGGLITWLFDNISNIPNVQTGIEILKNFFD
jgi:internalin A